MNELKLIKNDEEHMLLPSESTLPQGETYALQIPMLKLQE